MRSLLQRLSFIPADFRPGRWFWLAMVVIAGLPIGVATLAITWLSLPAATQCDWLNELTTSSSQRLYCAQEVAHDPTSKNLAEAIRLANGLPDDDPLRPDADRRIHRWSLRLLELGEAEFQAGQLETALLMLQAIPPGTEAAPLAEQRSEQWKARWQEAEDIQAEVEQAITDENWFHARNQARRLLILGNDYWANDRYAALMEQLQQAKEAMAQQTPANQPKVLPASLRPLTGDELMAQWQRQQEAEGNTSLSRAQQLAGRNLRAAINAAEQVNYDHPRYQEAQRLIQQWQTQVETQEDQPYLDRAMKLANQGDLASLQAAVAEASQVGFGRALYPSAQSKIDQWTGQIQQLQTQSQPPLSPP